ncbi:MAG TPA: apolipoprotein N-acyltransferase [Candidatus Binatia bacterium]
MTVAVVIFALIYDPFHAGALVFLALAPITLVFCDPRVPCRLGQAALGGFTFGLLAAMAIVGPWMFAASVDYFDRSSAWSIGFTLAINAGYVALFTAPAFMALRVLASAPPMLRVIGAASTWIAFEALRSADPFGNCWALLGQGFANLPLLREAAAFGGVPLLGWLAALTGSAIGVGLQPDVGARDAMRCTAVAVLAPLAAVVLGVAARHQDHVITPLQPLRVAVVQQEIASRDVWNPARRVDNWNSYLETTATLKPGSVDLVVWPESAAPFLLNADPVARDKMIELATTLGAAIMLGAPRSEDVGQGRALMHNSVYFFAPGASEPLIYDKQRLLPFIETMPAATDDPDQSPYAPGSSEKLFDVHGWQIAPLLCFEAVYPQYARQAVADGAHLLVNLSNDAWFDGGAGPEQHWAMSLMRTVELRRPMVRASNGGISGAIGFDGTAIGIPIRRTHAMRIYEIPPPPRTMTATIAYGEYAGWASGVLSLLCLLFALARLRARS